MTDIFLMQDEITQQVVTTLVSNVERDIIEQTRQKSPASLGAYELFLRARELRRQSRIDSDLVIESLFEQVIALDPGFAPPHAELAYIQYLHVTVNDTQTRRDTLLSKGFASARRALALEPTLPLAHGALANLHLRVREHADALAWAGRAVALNPGETESYLWLANVLSYVGRSAEALEQLGHAQRLDPLHPPLWDFYAGRALLHLGRYEEALTRIEAGLRRTPLPRMQRWKAAALAQLGRLEEARAALPDAALTPGHASVGEILRLESYLEGIELDRFIDGLRKAGLPE